MNHQTTLREKRPDIGMAGKLGLGYILLVGVIVAGLVLALTQTVFGKEPSQKIEEIEFTSKGSTIKGNLYLPKAYGHHKKYPAVVVTGAWTTVKEQMPATYAKALSEKGYAALTFDFRGWGESSDDIRYLEDPERKIDDILSAVAYLSNRPDINTTQIAGLGICASSGYMAHAAARSPKISALAMVAPWLHDAAIVRQVYGGDEGVNKLIVMGRKAEKSSEPVLIEAASKTNEKSLMYKVPYYTEENRGLIPEYDNRFNVASWAGWLNFDAQKAADHIQVPTLLVHSEDAAIPQGVKAFEKRMGNTARVVWLDKVTQFGFYDRPKAVTQSVKLVSDHYKKAFDSGNQPLDIAMIKTTLESMAVLADQNRYAALEQVFADQVTVDYTSLFGGAAEQIEVKKLMTQWASFLPGFEVTRHNLANIRVNAGNSFAKATADIRAEHFVEGLFWEITGKYEYELIKDNGTWKIAGLTLHFKEEKGTRDVLELAGSRAGQHPDSYILNMSKTKNAAAFNMPSLWAKPANPVAPGSENNENLKLVMKMFDAYAKGDSEVLRQVVAEDIEWYIPGRHPLSGIKRGVDELIAFFEELKVLGFKAEVMILAANENYVIDAHRGWNTKGTKHVDLNWILLYQIVDGKIKRVQNFSGDLYTSDRFFNH